jgi:tetratricopeptide (TPR) repeat protein
MSEVSQNGVPAAFEEFRSLWRRSIEQGNLEEAEEIIHRAHAWALVNGDERLVDNVVCSLAAVVIHLGRGDAEVPRLREILMRSYDAGNCRMAAYYISIHYAFSRNYKKSLFYARIACDHARQEGRTDWIAYTTDQLGNALLGESHIDEACRKYETAVSLVPGPSVWRARMLNNLGYCRVLQERFAEGYSSLYECLRLLRRFSSERYQVLPYLDLCFADLETGRYPQARRHGVAAIELAEKFGDADGIKNALYLLGETANLMGETETAGSYFSRLQQDYYPDAPYLPSFLLTVDVRKMVNLHA